MSFSNKVATYVHIITTNSADYKLPISQDAERRQEYLWGHDLGREWRLAVEYQAREVRRAIKSNVAHDILVTEMEALLRLIGEIDDESPSYSDPQRREVNPYRAGTRSSSD